MWRRWLGPRNPAVRIPPCVLALHLAACLDQLGPGLLPALHLLHIPGQEAAPAGAPRPVRLLPPPQPVRGRGCGAVTGDRVRHGNHPAGPFPREPPAGADEVPSAGPASRSSPVPTPHRPRAPPLLMPHECQKNAHRGVSLQAQKDQLTQLILRWRKRRAWTCSAWWALVGQASRHDRPKEA